MRVMLGPINTAGSGKRMAEAMRRADIDAVSVAFDHSRGRPLRWEPEQPMLPNSRNPEWRRYMAGFSHFLLWSGLSLVRQRHWWDEPGHVHPGATAILATGSEFRLPLVHKTLEEFSPYGDDTLSQKLITYTARWHDRLARKPLPVFVHTAGMLDYGPATFCPIIGYPLPNGPLLERKRPLVLYAPTNMLLKGARYVEALEPDGFDLNFATRNGLITPAAVDEMLVDCDILLGGLVLGDYGLTEIEGMAAGRVVIANVGARVRDRLPADLPIVHATPATLQAVIADVLANREKYREIAARGPGFVERVHDGRYSVAQLSDFLGIERVAA